MPNQPKYYRVLGTVEGNILFELKATQDFPVKSANLASVTDVRTVSYVSFPTFKFTSPKLEISVAVS